MKAKLRLLHLEDDACDSDLLANVLIKAGFECAITPARGRSEFTTALQGNKFDLIISDYSIPGFDGLSALEMARLQQPDAPFIFVSGTIGEEKAIEALKNGAVDYVIKDRLSRLVPAILRALKESEATRQRMQAEERLREQAALLDQAQEAICLYDMNLSILYWNRSAERLYGWSSREVLGKNAAELLYRSDSTGPSAALKGLIRNGEWHGELHHFTRSNNQIIVESRWTLTRDEQGQPKSILVISTDITGKKQTEAQMLRTQRMENIGALAGGIAHDLNNSLAPILMAMSFIREEVTSEDGRKLLGIMQISARRSVDMVKQILTFARGVGGAHELLRIGPIVKETLKLIQDTFPRSIEIQSSVPPHIDVVNGNPTQLNQVLLNLCVNARDAMPNGGRLIVEVENHHLDMKAATEKKQHPGSYVLIKVTDTGEGIPEELQQKIFEPFFTTKEIGKGTGLGLSTVMGIVKTHGGFVEVSSQLGKGSVFKVCIPSADRKDHKYKDSKPGEPIRGNGETLLLVDDEIAILEVTKLLLESFNYRVITARDGAEGLALYQKDQSEIKLVITDMMMPVMNGPELIQALRQIDPAVKIIGVSGLGSESALTKAGRPELQAFMKKPFATVDLLTVLHRMLTGMNADQAPQLIASHAASVRAHGS